MSRVRDCVKLAKETKVNERYCMTVEDTNRFYEAYRNDPWSLIFESFKFGYAQGQKEAKRTPPKDDARRQNRMKPSKKEGS